MGKLFLVSALTILLGSCAATSSGNAAYNFSKTAQKIGVFPVYPPREEFQIGDVYVVSVSRTDTADSLSTYLDAMPFLRKEADSFLKSRIVFRNTDKSPQSDLFGNTLETRADQRMESLPLAGFPSVSYDEGAAAGLGVASVLSALGLAGSQRTQVTLDFTDVRTYWVPNILVSDKVDKYFSSHVFGFTYAAKELRRLGQSRVPNPADVCASDREFRVIAVTRVYLTREISYTYKNAAIIGAGIRRATSSQDLSKTPIAPITIVNLPQAGANGELAVPTSDLSGLKSEIDKISSAGSEGSSLFFERWDARGITLKRKFERPVAIGWDGVEWTDGRGELFNSVCLNSGD